MTNQDKAKKIEAAAREYSETMSLSEFFLDADSDYSFADRHGAYKAGANFGYELAQEEFRTSESINEAKLAMGTREFWLKYKTICKGANISVRSNKPSDLALANGKFLHVIEYEPVITKLRQQSDKITELEQQLEKAEKVIEFIAKPRSGYVGHLLKEDLTVARQYLTNKGGEK
jgi:hypothetical protein